MAYIKKIRGRNVSGVVTAYGEVLFMPGGPVHSWTNRFAARVGSETRKAAPTNKRPRWAHYGRPLKATITASRPEYRAARGGGRVYAAVGSTAPHAYYVDQGTGVFGGNGPYAAKILPPWTGGSASLYEHTWRPAGPGGRRVAPVMIKGQKGQGFFDAGLTRGFARMRMRAFQVPGEGIGSMTNALASFPRGLERAGNTSSGGAFRAQLTEWRSWRDEAWGQDDTLGKNGGARKRSSEATSAEDASNRAKYAASRAASERRKREQAKAMVEQKQKRDEAAKRKAEKERQTRAKEALTRGNRKMRREATEFFTKIRQQYPNATLRSTTLPDGVVVYRVSYVVGGETIRQQWAYGYAT